jgi:hypothetical protein
MSMTMELDALHAGQPMRDSLEPARDDSLEPARDDSMPASADERHLRRLLARRVGMPGLYLDDGEASAQEHGISIDFMREPVADIEAKLMALNVARLEVKPLPPYYIGGPYHDGSYAMCVTSTGKVVHREPPNAELTGRHAPNSPAA